MKLTRPQTRLLIESIDFNGLWNYFNYIKKDPHSDDLKTLGKMALKVSDGTNLYALLSDMLPDISQNILPQLSEGEQEDVKLFYSKLSNEPDYQQAMTMYGWGRSLENPYSFNHEIPFIKSMRSYMEMVEENKRVFNTGFMKKMIESNMHLLDKDPDFSNELQKWIDHQVLQEKARPSFAEAIRKILKQAMDEGPED